MAFQLRPYQLEAIAGLRESILRGNKNVILHSPTGGGKTCTAAELISLARDKGKKVLFLANRRELIDQAHETMERFGIDAGIIMAGVKPDLLNPVQIASMQTYVRRMELDDKQINPWFHKASLIIVDECHGSISPSYQKILKSYSGAVVTIGLTATPCRSDSRGLGEYYDEIVSTVDIGGLIDLGFLVPVRYFVPSTPDLEKIKTVAGDYDKKELGLRMDKANLVGDIVENWLKICPERQTIIFAVNVKHSIHIVEAFKKVGVAAEHVDARTPTDERTEILTRLRNGETQIVSNVGILTEGFDFPAAGCIVLARPTKSLGLYLQMAGRGLRIYSEKDNCVLIDHGGNVDEHGLIEWPREWSLDGDEKAWSESKRKETDEKVMTCRACKLVYEGQTNCPDCGTEPKSFGKKINYVEADLEELDGKKVKVTMAEKRIFYCMMLSYARSKGWSDGAAAHRYKERFGCWPKGMKGLSLVEPDQKFLSYQRHLQIKYAKSREVNNARHNG